MAYKPYFKEWEDSRQIVYLHAAITIFMTFLFMGILINVPSEQGRAIVYMVMLIWAGIIGGFDVFHESNWLWAWAGFGLTIENAAKAFLIGGVVMFVVVSTQTLSIAAPLMVIPSMSFAFLYSVVGAPYIEEKFFRQFVQPTMSLVLMGNKIPFYDILGVLVTAFVFAVFHGLAYNWAIGGLVAAFIFSIFASVGNQLCKSGAFSFGAHLVNNLLVFIR